MSVPAPAGAPAPHPTVDEGLRAKEPARIAGMFDAIAPRYDLLNRVLSAGLDQRWRARAIRELALGPSDVLVDVCTGTADVAVAAMASATPPARVIGLDFSSEMLRRGLEKARRNARTRIDLVQADATRLPLPDRSADAATIAFGIRNVQDPERRAGNWCAFSDPVGASPSSSSACRAPPRSGASYLWYAEQVLPRIGGVISRHQQRIRLPAGVGRTLSASRGVRHGSPGCRLPARDHRPFDPRDRLSLRGEEMILAPGCRLPGRALGPGLSPVPASPPGR